MNLSDILCISYDTVDSTNSEARRLLKSGAITPPAVITAKAQTAGRGRQGKSFYSPSGTGIYMSIVTDLPKYESDIQLLTVRVSLAVSDAIYDAVGIRTGIKWVNDLYAGGRKVCGILTETVSCGDNGNTAAVIGVGINLTTDSFPPEIADKAASLSASAHLHKDSAQSIIKASVYYILNAREMYPDTDVLINNYKSRSVVIGKKITYEKGGVPMEGTAAGIDKTGALIVKLDDGFDYLQSGEISLKTW